MFLCFGFRGWYFGKWFRRWVYKGVGLEKGEFIKKCGGSLKE
jgi:hypothetical protein